MREEQQLKKKITKYCIRYGCLNNDRNSENVTFFKVPKDVERRKVWFKLLDREDLIVNESPKMKIYLVCSDHFEESSFKNIRLLKTGATPITGLQNQPHGDLFDPEGSSADKPNRKWRSASPETQFSEQSDNESVMSVYATDETHQDSKLEKELSISQLECQRLVGAIKNIQEELELKSKTVLDSGDDGVCKRIKKIMNWNFKFNDHCERNRYELEYKLFVLNLLATSPQTYKILQTVMQMPSKADINNFQIHIPPKIDDRVIKSIEYKVDSLPDTARYCTISVDSMTLKQHLYYDLKTDEVVGFQNVNGKISLEFASNAFCIMLQGIHIEWNQPIAYALLSSEDNFKELDLWLEEVIIKFSEIGIRVKAIISKQGSYFDTFAKKVKNVSLHKPYFIYDDEKTFYIIDVPDLINSIRNTLITSDFYYDDKIISWSFIQELYNDQINRNMRLIPKLTESHLNPNDIEVTEVKYAAQVFSRAVSVALLTYIDFGAISENAGPTANFLDTINNLFDVLNSNTIKCHSKYKSAFRNEPYQKKALDDGLAMLTKIEAINNETMKHNKDFTTSLVNLQISIKSIKLLYKDLRREGIKYLFTRRLNQDFLTNFFGDIRQHCKTCTELSPIRFRRVFSKMFVSNMLKSSRSEADIYSALLQAEDAIETKTFDLSHSSSTRTSVVSLDGETDHRMDLPKKDTIIYVSAYLLYKCMTKHRCDTIKKAFQYFPDLGYKNSNKRIGFFGALKMPPKEFIQYVEDLENVFTRNFKNAIQRNPGAKLIELLLEVNPQVPCDCFPLSYLIKLFIRLRIYTTLKFNNRLLRNGDTRMKNDVILKRL